MHDEPAIHFSHVSKVYQLHGSQTDQLISVLGLDRFGFRPSRPAKEFVALKDITFNVPRGQRIGIVGRNGAGKTTLLKLICGNFTPTSGEITVQGGVQALMNIGLGFHPDYTGRENVEASLQYNGLLPADYNEAIEGVIDFCELGDFLDQPFKTYSMGMQARLMFAAATAVKPDILIVDEVLGAGDAYFVAKSKRRVEALVGNGCTMLLVSHSMQQILELCNEAVWMDQGEIRLQGESFDVVKAYEEYIHGPIQGLAPPGAGSDDDGADPNETDAEPSSLDTRLANRNSVTFPDLDLQEPRFIPHGMAPALPAIPPPTDFSFVAKGGLSRWDSIRGLKIRGFTIVTERGETNELICLRPAKLVTTIAAEQDGDWSCRYGVAVYNHEGRLVLRLLSPKDNFACGRGRRHSFEMLLNPVQLGPGEFTVSVSIHQYGEIELFNSTPRYDLLNRSFDLKVVLPDTLSTFAADFIHSAEWAFGGKQG